jgi:hypothetical protein
MSGIAHGIDTAEETDPVARLKLCQLLFAGGKRYVDACLHNTQ